MLNRVRLPVSAHAGAEKIPVDQLLVWVVRLTMPVLDLHRALDGADGLHTVAAQAALLGYEALAQGVFVRRAQVAVVRLGCQAVLGEAGGLNSLRDVPHWVDFRRLISVFAPMTSGSPRPSFSSTSLSVFFA